MADFELIHESADGFTHQGHSASYRDAYIKVRRSFLDKALRTLKGAPLSIFFAVSLSQEPPDVLTICELTGYHNETVCLGLDFLVARHFLEELGRSGSNGVKVYRPLCYAYSGLDRDAPPDIEIPSATRNRNIRLRNRNNSDAENPRTDAENPRTDAENPRTDAENPRTIKKQPKKPKERGAENPRALHDMNDDVQTDSQSKDSFIHDTTTRKILALAGIEGKNLDTLAESVSPLIAAKWAMWLEQVDRTRWNNPAGYCVKKLLANAQAQPFEAKPNPQPARRRPVITGRLAQLRFDDPDNAADETQP